MITFKRTLLVYRRSTLPPATGRAPPMPEWKDVVEIAARFPGVVEGTS